MDRLGTTSVELRIGRSGGLYLNTGTYALPTWVEVALAKDVTSNIESETADADNRSAGLWGADVVVRLSLSVDFQMIWDTAVAYVLTMYNAAIVGGSSEFAILDGKMTDPTARGIRALCCYGKFSRPEPLRDVMVTDVTIKPTYSVNPPAAISGTLLMAAMSPEALAELLQSEQAADAQRQGDKVTR